MDIKHVEGIHVDMTGSSLKRKQKEAQKLNADILKRYNNNMIQNTSIRSLFSEAYMALTWLLETMSIKSISNPGDNQNLIRGIGFLMVLIGLSGVFIFEAF